jgi:methionyl aminopeptidase
MNRSAYIKTPAEIEIMRRNGQLVAQIFEFIEPYVKKGITTEQLDTLCHDYMTQELGAVPAPLNYHGFPKSICTSLNHVICHGIPNDRTLKEGDLLNIDISLSKDGYYADSCKMFFIGKPSILAERLTRIAKECLYASIRRVKPGLSVRVIGQTIQSIAHQHHFSVVEEFCGHGIGKELHEGKFQVLHYDSPTQENFILEAGMTFTIEPMINAGRKEMRVLPDKWTAVTRDHSLSAQFEHTLLVTPTGCEVLSLRKEESLQEIFG